MWWRRKALCLKGIPHLYPDQESRASQPTRAPTHFGAAVYNLGHTYLSPATLGLIGYLVQRDLLYLLAAIWVAHIGLDRMLGYGLKYSHTFGATHLGQGVVIGRGKGLWLSQTSNFLQCVIMPGSDLSFQPPRLDDVQMLEPLV